MELKEFLQLVTADGLRCIAVQTPVGFMQLPATDVETAVQNIKKYDAKQKNVYFALATFKEQHVNEKGHARVARKRKNVERLKALWVDIDFKDTEGGNILSALAEVQKFLAETNFPKPTAMVSSGHGLHLYWPLKEPIGLDSWRAIAEPFKQLCKERGLPADHACTADSARVLRPIGTQNWKYPSNPKTVSWVGGSGDTYEYGVLLQCLGRRPPSNTSNAVVDLPAHLRRSIEENGGKHRREYTKKNEREQDAKQVFKKCAVFRHILKTGGAEQDEPEWSATLNILAHLTDGAKFVHKLSSGHAGYDPDVTMEKWQQKVEAVEDGTGPTLCSTFEGWHPEKCQKCPFHQSKKIKTPKSLAYLEPTPTPPKGKSSAPQLKSVNAFQVGQYPKGWRVGGNGDCIERRVWDKEAKQYEWEPVLRQVWELRKASRSIQSDEFELAVTNTHGTSVRKFDIPSEQLGATTELTKTLARYGCPISGQNEFKQFRAFMETWLDELRKTNNVEDITGQLGWIIDTENEDHKVIGFATGTSAYYLDGTAREGVVSATGKYKGIMGSFKPAGSLEPWKEAAAAIVEQGCMHLVTLLSTAFAAPLMRFTGQPGAVVTFVSEDSAAGKSTGLRLAQAVWGNPRHAPATMDDTQTVVKNKLAFLQNLPVFWDEVRGSEDKMATFVQIAFQVAQGRDRERANSKAETIRAEEWHTLLAACSNDSLFDLAAEKAAESNAGIYRIFELKVDKNEYPVHDAELMSLITQLDNNFGHAGLVYAKYLTEHYEEIGDEVDMLRLKLEKVTKLKGPERFWIAAIAAMILGAKYAGKAGLVSIDVEKLTRYLINGLRKLRARAIQGKQRLSPRELIAAYMQQHQDGKVTVDWFPVGRGGQRSSELLGNHSHVRKISYVEASEINMIRVLKSDFRTWLWKSKQIKFNDKVVGEFEREVSMIESKARLGAGTKFAISGRADCLTFDLNEVEDICELQ